MKNQGFEGPWSYLFILTCASLMGHPQALQKSEPGAMPRVRSHRLGTIHDLSCNPITLHPGSTYLLRYGGDGDYLCRRQGRAQLPSEKVCGSIGHDTGISMPPQTPNRHHPNSNRHEWQSQTGRVWDRVAPLFERKAFSFSHPFGFTKPKLLACYG